MKWLSKTRWHAYCRHCTWVGKIRRNNLRALEDCHAHTCASTFSHRPHVVPFVDKGIKRTDG